jgi:death-on-curing protein
MKEPRWLDPRAVEDIHGQQIEEYGGIHGIRDRALFESALARPQNLFAYGSPTVIEMAAGYATGIIKNHPFLDGNKRTGFVAAVLFLESNGFVLIATEADATAATLALASSEITEEQFARWLEANSRPVAV